MREAREKHEGRIKEFFHEAGVVYPPEEIFIRVFKRERVLEVWARNRDEAEFRTVKTYRICMTSGNLGPKRQEGDRQIPEGFYFINGFNPSSRFHLSLQVSYPNRSDRILGQEGNLGGEIFIHGSCVTIGCIPILNEPIEELYVIAVDATAGGQNRIPVHIFPCPMNRLNMFMLGLFWPKHKTFWENIREGYDLFEENKRVPGVTVDREGRYVFSEN